MNACRRAGRIVWTATVVLCATTVTAVGPKSPPAEKSAVPAADTALQAKPTSAEKNVFPKYVLEVIEKTGHAGIEREIREGGNRILQGTEPMSPTLLIKYLADSLDRAGIDKETAKSHLLAVFDKGFFFKDQCIEAEAALVARCPELADWVKQRQQARNPLVVGQIRAFADIRCLRGSPSTCQGSQSGPVGIRFSVASGEDGRLSAEEQSHHRHVLRRRHDTSEANRDPLVSIRSDRRDSQC
jgi:hypothetical protein